MVVVRSLPWVGLSVDLIASDGPMGSSLRREQSDRGQDGVEQHLDDF